MFCMPVTYMTMRSKPSPKPACFHTAEFAQFEIPAVLADIHLEFFNALFEHIQPLFTLAAANDFANARTSRSEAATVLPSSLRRI